MFMLSAQISERPPGFEKEWVCDNGYRSPAEAELLSNGSYGSRCPAR